jgi:hypothetical protein
VGLAAGVLATVLRDGWAVVELAVLAAGAAGTEAGAADSGGGATAVCAGGGGGAGTDETCELWETCELCPLTPDTWDEWLTCEPTPAGAWPLTASSGITMALGSLVFPGARAAPMAGDAPTATAATAAARGIIGDFRMAGNASKSYADRYRHGRESRVI